MAPPYGRSMKGPKGLGVCARGAALVRERTDVLVSCHDGSSHERRHLGLLGIGVCACVGVPAVWRPCVATGGEDVVLCGCGNRASVEGQNRLRMTNLAKVTSLGAQGSPVGSWEADQITWCRLGSRCRQIVRWWLG